MRLQIVRLDLSTGEREEITDQVADEKSLHLFLNRTFIATIMCSPTNLPELAVGHLLTERIARKPEEIHRVIVDDSKGICRVTGSPDVNWKSRLRFLQNRSRLILSSCGGTSKVQGKNTDWKVESEATFKAKVVSDSVNRLNSYAQVYRKTGGTHSAGIFKKDGNLVSFAEDVGRHNAVDKVIGMASSSKTEFGACFLASTGRLTGETVSKAAAMSLPVVASLATAISSGVSAALDAKVTLVGFVRGRRMNIYTFPERILS